MTSVTQAWHAVIRSFKIQGPTDHVRKSVIGQSTVQGFISPFHNWRTSVTRDPRLTCLLAKDGDIYIIEDLGSNPTQGMYF